MKKLEEMGIVKGARLDVDVTRLGYDITSFIGIYLDKSSMYNEVIDQIKKIPEVVNAYYTTGNYSIRSEEHTSELQSRGHLVCRLLLEKKKKNTITTYSSTSN